MVRKLIVFRYDSIKFGEMTFTSCGGLAKWNPKEWDYELGKLV